MTESQADDTPRESPPLTGLLDGFGGYFMPTTEMWDEALHRGLVVLDTSAILDAYRMSPHAREDFLRVLEVLQAQLFVPHQVAREFHQRRVDAVTKRRDDFTKLGRETKAQLEKTRKEIQAHAEWAHQDAERVKRVTDALGAAFDDAQRLTGELKSGYDLDPVRMVRGEDPVLPRLEKILDGRVNRRPSDHQLREDREEAGRRQEAKLPPGFGDAGKDDPYGDYLWWAEVVRYAAVDRRPVLIVTNDVTKGDWAFDPQGVRVGAHPFLVEEIHRVAGVSLLLVTVPELLTKAQDILQTKVDESTVREAGALHVLEPRKLTQTQTLSLALRSLSPDRIADSWSAGSVTPTVAEVIVALEAISRYQENESGKSSKPEFVHSSFRDYFRVLTLIDLLRGFAPSSAPPEAEVQKYKTEEDPSDDDPDVAGQ